MSGACLLIPTTAHVAAGGGTPTHAGFLFAAALLSTACVGLADRRRSAGEIAALLFFSQPVLHVLLSLAGQHAEPNTVVPGPWMLLAHAAAATVLTVVLAGAEHVAWSLSALSSTVLLTRLRWLVHTPLPTELALAPSTVDDGVRCGPRVVDLVRSTPWRGPPALAGF